MEQRIRQALQRLIAALLPRRLYIKWIFDRIMPYELDTENPSSLNEKINMSKLEPSLASFHAYVDKLAVRERIDCEYLIPLLSVFKHAEEITVDKIPNVPFIAKTNHDSSGGVIVRDPERLDIKGLQRELRRRLRRNHWEVTKEYQYKPIEKRILFEKLLLTPDNRLPNDFKFNCFNGKVEFIYVSIDREGLNYRKIYSPTWEPLAITWTAPGNEGKFVGPEIDAPSKLQEMIRYAESLAQSFPYVRVDLYLVDNKIYFGELTLMHGSGLEPILPLEMDLYYGSLICERTTIR